MDNNNNNAGQNTTLNTINANMKTVFNTVLTKVSELEKRSIELQEKRNEAFSKAMQQKMDAFMQNMTEKTNEMIEVHRKIAADLEKSKKVHEETRVERLKAENAVKTMEQIENLTRERITNINDFNSETDEIAKLRKMQFSLMDTHYTDAITHLTGELKETNGRAFETIEELGQLREEFDSKQTPAYKRERAAINAKAVNEKMALSKKRTGMVDEAEAAKSVPANDGNNDGESNGAK